MRIGVLGPLEVRGSEVAGARLRGLLVRLVVDAGRAVPSERLVEDLWGGAPPAAPGNALQTLVSRLRALGGRDVVVAVAGGYRLGAGPGEVDAVEFERLLGVARALAAPAERLVVLRRALGLWRGPALAEFAGAEFADGAARRWEELRLAAVEDRVEAELALGLHRGLVAELEGLAAAHPLRERLHGLLMRALAASGRRAAALERYERTRRALAEQLGVDPSADLAALHLALLRGEPVSAPAPAAGPGPRRSNLPLALTSFVGREQERAAVRELLGAARLVTLTGPGGAGKTRLAVEVAAELADRYPDGVWLVPLAPVGSSAEVAQAALLAVGVPDVLRVGEPLGVLPPPVERLAAALEHRRLLLVLDNCEHLLDGAAELAAGLLSRAPHVRVLATSREPLGLTGESLCPVPSLPLPPLTPEAADGPDAVLGSPAVRLFADRAAAVRPGFRVDADCAPLVVDICRALDGIPLAIELAAARTRSLTLRQVADRLDDRFRLLAGGDRAALPRHRTLRAVVDWSWELLEDAERAVLAGLSVFAGGATPEHAERVCGPLAPGADVVGVIAALIDKSLVRAVGDGAGGEVRYQLLETVRAYAAEKSAESGAAARTADAHAACFLALAERAEPELRGPGQVRWSARLDAERDNLHAALGHLVAAGDAAGALRLAGALVWFWITGDRAGEAGGWALAVRELVGGRVPPGLADAHALCTTVAVLVGTVGGPEEPGPAAVRQAVATVLATVPDRPAHPVLHLLRPGCALLLDDRPAGLRGLRELLGHADPWVRAAAHLGLGHLALDEGRLEPAAEHLDCGSRAFERIGDRWGRNAAIGGLLELALIRGDGPAAVRLGEEAYRTGAAAGADHCAPVLVQLGRARAEAGDPVRGRQDLERAVGIAERLGEHANAAAGLLALSDLARRSGDPAAARAPLLHALESLDARTGRAELRRAAALVHSRLGCLAEQQHDLAEAARRHAEALAALGQDPHRRTRAVLAEGLAALAAARGEHRHAAALLGAAHTLHGYRPTRSPDATRATEAATRALGPTAFAAAYAHGRHQPPELRG
ncbi:BTAD domain-containing putative transcriptional regulator [Kitasatospora sp. NPDC088783]|uniref:BTAD domain-containing putative transcriptional regulator n=1 Tax=Kitasatospora sp. NPDC088783 TaxID=3364077 RepID=UPI00382A16FE